MLQTTSAKIAQTYCLSPSFNNSHSAHTEYKIGYTPLGGVHLKRVQLCIWDKNAPTWLNLVCLMRTHTIVVNGPSSVFLVCHGLSTYAWMNKDTVVTIPPRFCNIETAISTAGLSIREEAETLSGGE
jgi:hypothetical protein